MYFNFGGGGGGGMPGGMGGRPRKEVDTTKFYKELGLDKDADPTSAQIKKAFRRAAMKHHPDKGGDPEKFKAISKAYEILGDAEKKELYDEGGEEAVEHGARGGGGGGMSDIFEMFGGGGGRRGGSRKRQGEDVVFPLKVSLNDLYKSTSKKLRLTKNVICIDCSGKGGTGSVTCRDCSGQGVKVVLRQIGPGMVQQMRARCPKCSGTGQCIAEKNKCKKCHANKTVKEKKTLEVFVNKGMKHGQKIVFHGEADEAPNTVPGDVVVVLQQLEHSVFKREGDHLFMKKTITLKEALTGFEFTIDHLDGRQLLVKSTPGKVYRPGDFKAIMDQGMPKVKNPTITGNLYIEFTIEFPENGSLDAKSCKMLAALLPKSDEAAPPNGADVEDVDMVDVNMEEERKKFKARAQREAYEEREEDDSRGGGRQQQCQSQ